MKSFYQWKEEKYTCEKLVKACQEYFSDNLNEGMQTARYSVEVNYRTTGDEALEGFAKICLGFVSAALKNYGYHTKQVFSEKPVRLLVNTRNWDDGSWCGVITWNPEHHCFIISKGFYNKDRKTVSVQTSKKCAGNSAADVAKELHNTIHHLKSQPDKHKEPLKPVSLKRGPKS